VFALAMVTRGEEFRQPQGKSSDLRHAECRRGRGLLLEEDSLLLFERCYPLSYIGQRPHPGLHGVIEPR